MYISLYIDISYTNSLATSPNPTFHKYNNEIHNEINKYRPLQQTLLLQSKTYLTGEKCFFGEVGTLAC